MSTNDNAATLLAACKAALVFLDRTGGTYDERIRIVRQLEDAISKVEG